MDGNVTFLGEFSKKLVANTFFNFLGRCWSFILTLLLTPFILSHLDVHDFGTWVLMTIFISAFNPGQVPLFDLGGVFMKYISEYYTYEDFEGINRVLTCGLFFYSVFGIGLISIGLLLERPLFHLLHISDSAAGAYLLFWWPPQWPTSPRCSYPFSKASSGWINPIPLRSSSAF